MYALVRSLTKFYYQDTPILLFLSGTCISTHELDYFRYETPSKVSFSVVNKLLHRTSEAQLPAYDNLSELNNRFANFFAFDTIDHQILLARLAGRLGITGRCLHWIKSYLDGRKLRVAIDGILSDSKALNFGVP